VQRRFDAVIFDFDYTLADSSRAVVECANTALRALGLPEASEHDICRTIGLALPETLVRLAGDQHRHRATEFRQHWRRRSDEIMVAWTQVYPYVPAALEGLKQCKLGIGIVSTKYRSRIEAVLGREGLAHYFEAIVGGEDVEAFKPDPQGLLACLERLAVPRSRALYVGDSITDAETAQGTGLPFLAVLSGKTRREEFAAYPVESVLDTVADVSEWVECRRAHPSAR
jgi:phosphoglycolate phosphatase